MEKLELKHWSPYIPYKLHCLTPKHRFKYGTQEVLLVTGISNNLDDLNIEFLRDDDLEFSNTMKWVKPILRPLSDLTKEIEVNGEKFVPLIKLTEISGIVLNDRFNRLYVKTYKDDPQYIECYENTASQEDRLCISIFFPEIFKCEYWIVQKLFKWHFDCFDLIKNNLAIDINTI